MYRILHVMSQVMFELMPNIIKAKVSTDGTNFVSGVNSTKC